MEFLTDKRPIKLNLLTIQTSRPTPSAIGKEAMSTSAILHSPSLSGALTWTHFGARTLERRSSSMQAFWPCMTGDFSMDSNVATSCKKRHSEGCFRKVKSSALVPPIPKN